MPKEYILKVKPKNTPLLKRKCNKCNNNRFYCSDKFRMNNQKKNIDVWLIYRCLRCENTYNLSIFSRTCKSILKRKKLFIKFSENNIFTVWRYAFSPQISQKNQVEFDFQSVAYDIQYEYSVTKHMRSFCKEDIIFKIKYPINFKLKLFSIMKELLKLSNNQLTKLIDTKVIYSNEKCLHKKYKIKNNDRILINIKELNKVCPNAFLHSENVE